MDAAEAGVMKERAMRRGSPGPDDNGRLAIIDRFIVISFGYAMPRPIRLNELRPCAVTVSTAQPAMDVH